MTNPALLRAAERIRSWRENVTQFAWDNFRFEPDAWQKKAFDVFPSQDPDKRRISLQACVGPGKTAVLAICGWNFLCCYGGLHDHPNGAAVSITSDNLRDNLWKEFAIQMGKSEFIKQAFAWTSSRIFAKDHPETWWISAKSWPKTANPEDQGKALSGLHSKFILVLVDESGEIPIEILKASEQALSNCAWGKEMQAGNPSSLDGMLYAAANKLRHLWFIIRVTGDPDDPERSPRIDKEWARQQIETYGLDDPWIMYSIRGLFPPASINALLGLEEVQAAMGKHLREDQYAWAQKRLGIDAAWRGDDKWVIFPRQGLAAFKPVAMRNPKTQEIGARIIMAKQRFGSDREYFDDTGGYAAGASDYFENAGYSPVRIDFSGKAIDPRFYNIRAEMWWNMSQWVKSGGALPNVPELVAELTVPTYTYKNGKLIIEPKDQVKARLKRSPDHADALCLTFAEPEMPGGLVALGQQSGHAASEWNPFRVEEQKAVSDWDPMQERGI